MNMENHEVRVVMKSHVICPRCVSVYLLTCQLWCGSYQRPCWQSGCHGNGSHPSLLQPHHPCTVHNTTVTVAVKPCRHSVQASQQHSVPTMTPNNIYRLHTNTVHNFVIWHNYCTSTVPLQCCSIVIAPFYISVTKIFKHGHSKLATTYWQK